jgi:hypothetical protein
VTGVDKPRTNNGDLAHLPAALVPLTEQQRWVVWPWELRTTKAGKSKWTKPPRQPREPGHNARTNDPSTWGSYSDAVAAVAAGNADGIGFMLKDSDIGAIDLDHCVDGENTKLVPWAERLHEEALGAYQEITVSGGGLRIIGKVSGPETHRKFTFDRKTNAGIELYRNTARYITVSGIEMDGPCAELPPLDDLIDRLLARHGRDPDGLDFNQAGTSARSIKNLVENGAPEGERSELFQAVVWHFAHRGRSIEEIIAELARHPNGIGAKYADRLSAEVTRSYEKWRSHKRAAAAGAEPAPSIGSPWPQIFMQDGELPRVVDEAEDALLLLGREIYQRGGLIVRPVQSEPLPADTQVPGWNLIPMTRPYLVETLCCAAQFFKYDRRAKSFMVTDAPEVVAETYLMRRGRWRLPALTGIVSTPFLRIDGSICEQPGYDAESGLLFKPNGESFPPVPQQPSKDDATAALVMLKDLIASFPFVTSADRSVALSAMLTPLDRHAMETAPLHAFTSPTAGTGKSMLVDIVATLATGRHMPVIAQGRTEEELEKRLGAALLAGDIAISLDNCDHPLESVFLCQALTQRKLNIRVLGKSKNVETLVNATIFATGNNLVIAGDLTRRSLRGGMDARCERPELRTFDHDALQDAQANRGKLVTAMLTILRAWHLSGERIPLSLFGSFEDWSQRIREPLVWLGCADPCSTVTEMREGDPEREALAMVVMQWKANLNLEQSYTVQEIIGRAINVTEFHAALLVVAEERGGKFVSNDRLGRWFKKVQGKIINEQAHGKIFSYKLLRDGIRRGYPLWKLLGEENV